MTTTLEKTATGDFADISKIGNAYASLKWAHTDAVTTAEYTLKFTLDDPAWNQLANEEINVMFCNSTKTVNTVDCYVARVVDPNGVKQMKFYGW